MQQYETLLQSGAFMPSWLSTTLVSLRNSQQCTEQLAEHHRQTAYQSELPVVLSRHCCSDPSTAAHLLHTCLTLSLPLLLSVSGCRVLLLSAPAPLLSGAHPSPGAQCVSRAGPPCHPAPPREGCAGGSACGHTPHDPVHHHDHSTAGKLTYKHCCCRGAVAVLG